MSIIHLLYPGQRFSIAAFAPDENHNEVFDFLNGQSGLELRDATALKALFKRHGDSGLILGKDKCRFLADGIFEYKARRGGRLAWFYDQDFLVVCAVGIVKKRKKADPAFI